jgi:transketolase
MGGVLNGMALHKGLIPFGATFLIFSDYMRPAIRLAALMELHVIYVFTHDSIGLGEDGPTHQPVEQLAALRAIPNLTVIRPCDANETADAWKAALQNMTGPVALVLTRQNLPVLAPPESATQKGLDRGGYILSDPANSQPELILMASGSEVHIALGAADKLEKQKVSVRVVSMPSWELFNRQPSSYQDQILPPDVTARVAVEAGCAQGWHRYVGLRGEVVSLDHFGASAPYQILYEKFDITTEQVVEKAMKVMNKTHD